METVVGQEVSHENRAVSGGGPLELVGFYILDSTPGLMIPTAMIVMNQGGRTIKETAAGDEVPLVLFEALNRIASLAPCIQLCRRKFLGDGVRPEVRVNIIIRTGDREYRGFATDRDLRRAEFLAYLMAINKALSNGAGHH